MAKNFVDFRAIKQLASMRSVLDRYGVQLRRVNQHSLRGNCPLPTHSSDKSKESFGADIAKNIWACQSSSCSAARQGKRGGNVLDFVSIMENCSIRDAAIKLHEWYATPSGVAPTKIESATGTKEKLVAEREEGSDDSAGNRPLTFALKNVDCGHQYLRSRGIMEEVAKYFGVGLFSGRGSMNGRVVIPIQNERGELVAYAGRSVDGAEPKYKLPAGFHKSIELFNLHRAVAADRAPVILVEGFFDCMKVHQAGFPHVVALMGCSLSDSQVKLLCPFKSVILFLDGDDAGREGARMIAARLVHAHFVKVVSLPEGKQPDRLSSDEIRRLLEQ